MCSNPLHLMRGKHGLVVNRVIPLGDVVDEKLPMLLGQLCQHAGTDGARGMASEGGMQSRGCGMDSANGSDLFNCHVGVLAGQSMSLRIAD